MNSYDASTQLAAIRRDQLIAEAARARLIRTCRSVRRLRVDDGRRRRRNAAMYRLGGPHGVAVAATRQSEGSAAP